MNREIRQVHEFFRHDNFVHFKTRLCKVKKISEKVNLTLKAVNLVYLIGSLVPQ